MTFQNSSGSFADKIGKSKKKNCMSGPTIIEAENDFPIIPDYMRVGSAHQVCSPEQDADNASLLARIVHYVMDRYEPNQDAHPILIEHK